MSIATELKRRLESDDRHISKRLKLAENVLAYPFLPLLQKEEIVIDWLCANLDRCNDTLSSQGLTSTLEQCVKLLNFKTFPSHGRNKLFSVLSKLLLEDGFVEKQNVFKCFINLLENSSALIYFQQYPIELFLIFHKLFNFILLCKKDASKCTLQESEVKRVFNHLLSFIKNFNKKSALVNPLLESNLFSTILKFSDDLQHSSKVYNICQNVIFPQGSCALYKSYLSALIKGSDLMKLFEEKGEMLRPVVRVIDILLKYSPSQEFTENDLIVFLGYFINSYKYDEALIFIFNVFLYKCIGVEERYIEVDGTLKVLNLPKHFIELIHLHNLNHLAEFNVNLNVSLPFSSSNNVDESKLNFIRFLQCLTTAICNEKSLNNMNLLITKQTFLLDPEILFYDLYGFLSNVIVQKKNKNILNDYNDVLITIMNTMFKMSKGSEFLMELLENIKTNLEKIDSEQQKHLKKREKLSNKEDIVNINNELLFEEDIFSVEFYERFAKLGSELMTRQHTDLFKELINHFNKVCIAELEADTLLPSTILLTEIVCSLLSHLCDHSKTADHNIPSSVYQKFHDCFDTYGKDTLSKFSSIVLNSSDNIRLYQAFLGVCKSYGGLKLLLWQFQPHFGNKLLNNNINQKFSISDITLLHPYVSKDIWKKIYKSVIRINDEICINSMNMLILQNTIVDFHSTNDETLSLWNNCVKHHIFSEFKPFLVFHEEETYSNFIFSNLTTNETKQMSNMLLDSILNNQIEICIVNKSYIHNNRDLLSSIAEESVCRIMSFYESEKSLKQYSSLFKLFKSENFDSKQFTNETSKYSEFLTTLTNTRILMSNSETKMSLKTLMELLDIIPIQFLKEEVQNFVLFSVFAVLMNSINNKSEKLNIQNKCSSILLKTFDLSYKFLKIFNVLPLKLFIQLIEKDYFKLTSTTEKRNNMFYLMKQILLGSINKENIDTLNQLIELLSEGCNSEKIADVTNDKIQTLFMLFTILSTSKKTNLDSEMKDYVLKMRNSIAFQLSTYFHSVKWKRLYKNLTNIDQQNLSAHLNSIIPYCLIISEELSKSSKDSLNKIGKALNFLIEVCSTAMLGDEISSYHSKGCCMLFNIVLKNFKALKEFIALNEECVHTKIWTCSEHFLKINHIKIDMEYTKSKDLTLENITLIYESCSVKFFNSFLMKRIHQFGETIKDTASESSTPNVDNIVKKSIWSCFLNADLRVIGKTEARDSAVKKTVKNIYLSLQHTSTGSERSSKPEEDQETPNQSTDVDKPENLSVDISMIKKLNTMYSCLDIITEFVGSKKINSFNVLIDTVIQIPIVINFDMLMNHPLNKKKSLEAFCVLFDKCVILLNKLLSFRLELLQDRLPSFLQSYRKLLKILSLKSNSEQITDKNDIEKLEKLGLGMERITRYIVKNDKQDISRIASYIVSDIVSSYQKVSICPSVKFHLQNCAYCLIQVLDSHAIGFMMRNMSDTSRIMFQQLYDNYKKYYKYIGKS